MNPNTVKNFILSILLTFSITSFGQTDSTKLDSLYTYTSIEEALLNPSKVQKLVLKRNRYNSFPIEVFQFHKLLYLDISKNNIKFIPSEIKELSALQVLDISKNNLSMLPKEIGSLVELRELYLSKNEQLIVLPKEIGELTNLVLIDLWSTSIEKVPNEISQLKNLKSIDVRGTYLNNESILQLEKTVPNSKVHYTNHCDCQD